MTAREIHELAHESLGARTVIPVRGLARQGIRNRGRHRGKQRGDFNTKAYHQRVMIEKIHSTEKRKIGDFILAKSAGRPHGKPILGAFPYNVGRLEAVLLSFVEGFYTADIYRSM